MLNSMLHYIEKSPTCFHAVQTLEELLQANGYCYLPEGGWELVPGGKYYTTRSGSSLEISITSYMQMTSHLWQKV